MKVTLVLLISLIVLLSILSAACGSPRPPTTSPTPASEVSLSIISSPTHLGASESYQFQASVKNASDISVTWSVSACSLATCGTISSSGVYAAPPFIASATPITVTATSHADSSKSATASLMLMPVSVTLVPNTPARIPPGGTQAFAATLDHDPGNAGVTWEVSGLGCSGESCGTVTELTTTSAAYYAPETAPTPSTVTLTAKSVTDSNQRAWAVVTVSALSYRLQGDYAFMIAGWPMEAIAGHFNTDGNGTFSGIWDTNRSTSIDIAQPITGEYNISPEGFGTLIIRAGSIARTYIVSLDDSGTTGRLAEATLPPGVTSGGSSGYFMRQESSYFDLASLTGDRVIATFGEATGSHVAALGRFTSSGEGSLTNGVMDLSWAINQNVGQFPNMVTLAGTFGPPDKSTGRGTAAFRVGAGTSATYNFAYYIVSAEQTLLLQADVRGFTNVLIPTLTGEVRKQTNAGSFSTASLNVPVVFHVTDATWRPPEVWKDHPMIRVGQIAPDNSGSLTLTFDENRGGSTPSNAVATSSYSVANTGRATWSAPEETIAYMLDQNRGYFMTHDADGAGFAVFEPQEGGPFNINSIKGDFLLNTGPPAMGGVENDSGWLNLDSNGNSVATLYINAGSGASAYNFSGSTAVGSNGRGTLVLNTTPTEASRQIVFWTISPSRAVGILSLSSDDTRPVMVELLRKTE